MLIFVSLKEALPNITKDLADPLAFNLRLYQLNFCSKKCGCIMASSKKLDLSQAYPRSYHNFWVLGQVNIEFYKHFSMGQSKDKLQDRSPYVLSQDRLRPTRKVLWNSEKSNNCIYSFIGRIWENWVLHWGKCLVST